MENGDHNKIPDYDLAGHESPSNEPIVVAGEGDSNIPSYAGEIAIDSIERTERTERTSSQAAVIESIRLQGNFSYSAYRWVTDQLGDMRGTQTEAIDPNTFDTNLKSWLTDDKVNYIVKAIEDDPGLEFTLVATPNLPITAKEITKLAKKFGEDQPSSTRAWTSLYRRYSSEQLSGYNQGSNSTINFVLIPNKLDPAVHGKVGHQNESLLKLQHDNPFLRVPRVIEDIAYWQTLRASGYNLVQEEVYNRTYIRHFDLPKKRVTGRAGVPRSFVHANGRANLRDSAAAVVYHGRLAIG